MTNQTQVKHTPAQHLDNVYIMQKYYDSNKVSECRKSFDESYQYIVKCVNVHDELVEALKSCLNCLNMDSDMQEDFKNEIKQAKQALKKAGV